MRFYLPLCFLNRHWPDRNRAKWDGSHYVSKCRVCGTPIRRRDKGQWQRDWLEPAA